MIKMNFNNVDFSPWLIITKGFTTFGGADFDVTTKDVGFNGTYFVKNRYKEKIITVPFYIEYPQLIDYDAFQRALYVNEPQKLTFSHQPYRYYYAIPTGDLDFDEFRMNGKGTLTFIVPDGVAHSTTYRRFENGTVSSDKIVFDLVNDGNVPANPIITVKHNAENGYIGIVNSTGAIEVGNIEEADTEIVKLSEILLDYREDIRTIPFESNQGVFNDTAWKQTGTVSGIARDGRNFLQLSKINSTSGQNAGSVTFDMPTDSNGEAGGLNDYLWWRMAFELNVSEKAIFKMTVSDVNGKFMYGVQAYKHSNGINATFNVLVDQDGPTVATSRDFKTTNRTNENPLCLKRGTLDLKRTDDKLRWYWDGKYQTIIVPSLRGRKSAKIHVMFGNFGASKYANINYLGEFFYRKDYVEKTNDIPNRYQIGSNIILNSENDTVTVDGLERITDVVHGSTFPTIPTGNSQLEIYCSSWIENKPTVTVEFEERWL